MAELIEEIEDCLHRLFPLNRSITGPGNRESLRILQDIVPLEIREYPCGTPIYDWVIPNEWTVRDAWVKDADGNKLVDYASNNLHLLGYSEPVHRTMSAEALQPHLHVHDDLPEAIPYRTSYYKRDWGFCVTRSQFKTLTGSTSNFEVMIDSAFDQRGSLSVGELIIPGRSKQEILVSTYICHPSMGNDNLSGMVLTAFIARELLRGEMPNRGYRIVWVPETIGAIAYCAFNEADMKQIKTGLVVTCVAGEGLYSYKQSHQELHSVNVVIEDIFREAGIEFITYPFDIHGSDERQYSSPGFRINTASITKDKYYEYPGYHSSLDNLDFIRSDRMAKSMALHLEVLRRLSNEPLYRNRYPNCEVMLSKHGLYPEIGGAQLPGRDGVTDLDTILWLLWLCDGETGLYEVGRRIGISNNDLTMVIDRLVSLNILEKIA